MNPNPCTLNVGQYPFSKSDGQEDERLKSAKAAVGSHVEVCLLNLHPIAQSVGRVGYDHTTEGLAQHYGLSTNLVDLSFSPLVATCFACSNTTAPPVVPRDTTDARLVDCAVIYVIGAPAFATIAAPKFEFPPSYSKRLYQQKGLFANFGPYPGATGLASLENYSAPWCWLQQNCQRIFFHRTYPVITGADELRDNHTMDGDEFMKELADRIKNNTSIEKKDLVHRPPWSFDPLNAEEHGKRSADFHFRIDAYLRKAALIKFEDGDEDLFDPLMIGLLKQQVTPELMSIMILAEETQHPGLAQGFVEPLMPWMNCLAIVNPYQLQDLIQL